MTSLQCRINLVAKVAYATGPALSRAPCSLYALGGVSFLSLVEDLFSSFFFSVLVDIFPGAKRFCFYQRGGGRTPSPEGTSRVGLCGRGGGANSGGGGRRCKHWPPGAGDPRYATVHKYLWSVQVHMVGGTDQGVAQLQQDFPPD